MAFPPNTFKRSALSLALTSTVMMSQQAIAEETAAEVTGIERIQVTGSRRSETVQDIPLNITALDADVMKDHHITELSDIALWVPGLTIPDQGGFYGSPIIVRGLNTNDSNPGSDGGTVATYIGEAPLRQEMKVLDVERVEVLIGPQGTLYGAGTLGGAIRYLPKKPMLDETSGSIYGDLFSVAHSDDQGGEAGFTFNTPIIDNQIGLRIAFNHLNDPGFVDNNYLLRQPGVSLADPDWNNANDVNANLTSKKSANSDETTTARVTLRWQASDNVDVNLAYHYQKQALGGRSLTHYQALSDENPLKAQLGKYDNAYRYPEIRENKTSLLSLDIIADLGFAELTSATSASDYDAEYTRDQSDLLIGFNYGYEEFPAFSSFARDYEEEKSLTQEVRLVSKLENNFSWIVGAYYNHFENDLLAQEFTPGFSQFAVDNWDAIQIRPDELEYHAPSREESTEKAIFGELTIQISEKLDLTLGARFYDYQSTYAADADFPLYNTLFEGAAPDEINVALVDETTSGNGSLFKFNLNYQINNDILSYFTISEGFRLGGSNGTAACPDNVADLDRQIVCALPEEFAYQPDTTLNFELGLKSSWLNNRLHFNAALYYMKWDDAQVNTSTEYGASPITINAVEAQTQGVELLTRYAISDNLMLHATYAYTKAELSEDSPLLSEAVKGDRLPTSPEHQFSLGANYNRDLGKDYILDVDYGLNAQSDVYTSVGLTNFGEKLPGYALSNLSASISKDQWQAIFYIDNLFDEYAYTSVRQNKGVVNDVQNSAILRHYGHYIVQPRTIGLRVNYQFD